MTFQQFKTERTALQKQLGAAVKLLRKCLHVAGKPQIAIKRGDMHDTHCEIFGFLLKYETERRERLAQRKGGRQ